MEGSDLFEFHSVPMQFDSLFQVRFDLLVTLFVEVVAPRLLHFEGAVGFEGVGREIDVDGTYKFFSPFFGEAVGEDEKFFFCYGANVFRGREFVPCAVEYSYTAVAGRGIYRINEDDERVVAMGLVKSHRHFALGGEIDREETVLQEGHFGIPSQFCGGLSLLPGVFQVYHVFSTVHFDRREKRIGHGDEELGYRFDSLRCNRYREE